MNVKQLMENGTEGVYRISHSMYVSGLGAYWLYYDFKVANEITFIRESGNKVMSKWEVGSIPKGAEIIKMYKQY